VHVPERLGPRGVLGSGRPAGRRGRPQNLLFVHTGMCVRLAPAIASDRPHQRRVREPSGRSNAGEVKTVSSRRVDQSLSRKKSRKPLSFRDFLLVGLTGFEPATPWRVQPVHRVPPKSSGIPRIPLCLQGTKQFTGSDFTRLGSGRSRLIVMGKWWATSADGPSA
jgi:hypothetical protein